MDFITGFVCGMIVYGGGSQGEESRHVNFTGIWLLLLFVQNVVFLIFKDAFLAHSLYYGESSLVIWVVGIECALICLITGYALLSAMISDSPYRHNRYNISAKGLVIPSVLYLFTFIFVYINY